MESNLPFHRREWRALRIGWALIVLVLLAAISGAFGEGPLAKESVSLPGGATLEFARFARKHAKTDWVFTLPRAAQASLTIGSSFLACNEISNITPEPERQASSADVTRFEFDASPRRIVFDVEPKGFGWCEGDFSFGDSRSVRVRQLVYP